MKQIKKPLFKVIYAETDITKDITDSVESITYTDHQHGSADDVQIVIADSLHIWRDEIVPVGGELFQIFIGFTEQDLLDLGTFEVDVPEYGLTDHKLTLNGSSTSIKKALKENSVEKYNDKTLKEIVEHIASKYGMTVAGNIESIKFERKTQNSSDLEFLRELAEDYGYLLKVLDSTICFVPYADIDNGSIEVELKAEDLLDGSSLRNNENKVYKSAEVSYHRHGKLNKIVVDSDTEVQTDNILKIKKRCENKEQAKIMAKAHLWRVNRELISGRFSVALKPDMISGITGKLVNAGKLSGSYQIKELVHSISRDGSTTDMEVYRAKS